MPIQEPVIWIELITAIASIVTAITAAVSAVIGFRGLNRWRTETIGKQKTELAEEVLADFYEARDIINSARFPGILGGEGNSRERFPVETKDDTRTLNGYFVVIERLSKKAEFFARLHARSYRFIAHFGEDKAKPYNDLQKIHQEIRFAVSRLNETYRSGELRRLPKKREEWEATIGWVSPDVDPIRDRLDKIVAAIEDVCRPAIQETVR